MAADELGLVGRTVDQIRFDACVDAGGFGVVYRGFDLRRGIAVAVKCLRIPYGTRSNPELARSVEGRFADESKILAKLSAGHPDIVACLGSGTLDAPATGERTPYMVLEWLAGRTLAAELRERRGKPDAARSLDDTTTLLDSGVSALAYAHAQEVVHRDVKPANLFLAKTDTGVRLKVLDFGLAKILVDDILGVKPSVETQVGVQFCSPSYGAPEQFSPKIGPIGPWTDVYALALVVLELLLGKRVRQATTLADGAIKALDPKEGSPTATKLGLTLPPGVEDVLARAVAIDPKARPHDAGVFWSTLRDAARAGVPRGNAAFAGTMLMLPNAAGQFALGGTALMPPAAMTTTMPLAPPLPARPSAVPSPLAASVFTDSRLPVAPAPLLPAPAPARAPAPAPPIVQPSATPSLPPAGVPARGLPSWVLVLLVTLLGAAVGAAVLALVLWRTSR